MTSFEQYLINKGYIRFSYNEKTKQYIEPIEYNLSSVGGECLEYTYYHKNDKIVNKIRNNETVIDSDKDNRIVFGLSEQGKPPTLLYPRPTIAIKLNNISTSIEANDDYMNRFLAAFNNHNILAVLKQKESSVIFI